MPVEERAGQHVGAGDGELERTARNGGGQLAIGQQVERALAQRPLDNAGRLTAEAHGIHLRERLVIAAADVARGYRPCGRMKYSIMPLVSG